MITDKKLIMSLNKTVCLILIFFGACSSQSSSLKKSPESIKQYLISFKNGQPVDTSLQVESFYNSKGVLKKVVNYSGNKVLKTTVYLEQDSVDLKEYLSKSDNINYAIKSKAKESNFFNGNLTEERLYDSKGNITKQVTYDRFGNSTLVIQNFIYSYYSEDKKKSETILWNKDTVSAVRYLYNDSLLVEKFYLINKCCDRNQPIPADKIIYEYDKNRNLTKEIEVIDRAIKRGYKNNFNGYHNEVIITVYLYDSSNRLFDKKIYTPNFSDDPKKKVDQLFELPATLQEEYIYKYN